MPKLYANTKLSTDSSHYDCCVTELNQLHIFLKKQNKPKQTNKTLNKQKKMYTEKRKKKC